MRICILLSRLAITDVLNMYGNFSSAVAVSVLDTSWHRYNTSSTWLWIFFCWYWSDRLPKPIR